MIANIKMTEAEITKAETPRTRVSSLGTSLSQMESKSNATTPVALMMKILNASLWSKRMRYEESVGRTISPCVANNLAPNSLTTGRKN